MNRASVKYSDLNARAKENYNAAQLGAALAHYGYFAMKLTDDFNGADLIALREGEPPMMIQLKSRPTIDRKYMAKGLYMSFPVDGRWCVILHDELVELFEAQGYLKSASWRDKGGYSMSAPSQSLSGALSQYMLQEFSTEI